MNEGTRPVNPPAQPEEQTEFKATMSEFSRSVQASAGMMSSAADQFLSRISGLVAASDRLERALESHRQIEGESRKAAADAQAAITSAQAAAEQARESQRAAEAMVEHVRRDYGEMTKLVEDLRERIAALAVLGRPMPAQSQAAEPLRSSVSPPSPAPASTHTPAPSMSTPPSSPPAHTSAPAASNPPPPNIRAVPTSAPTPVPSVSGELKSLSDDWQRKQAAYEALQSRAAAGARGEDQVRAMSSARDEMIFAQQRWNAARERHWSAA